MCRQQQSSYSHRIVKKDSIRGAPRDLLEAAYRHVEVRLVALAAERTPSARTRATERWLGRWAQIIESELNRQQEIR